MSTANHPDRLRWPIRTTTAADDSSTMRIRGDREAVPRPSNSPPVFEPTEVDDLADLLNQAASHPRTAG